MTGNASKWMEIVVKGCIRAINASNWLRMAEISRNGRKCIGNWHKWIKLTSNGWVRKFYVEYQCNVQSYAAAALAWVMPGRISDFGIPFQNWRALLSRHQLGATRLTVSYLNLHFFFENIQKNVNCFGKIDWSMNSKQRWAGDC